MLYRTDTPFTKVTSKEYRDPEGRKAQVEILGKGQQCVIYAIHPDTHRPYHWHDTIDHDFDHENTPIGGNFKNGYVEPAARQLDPIHCPARHLGKITEAQARAIVAEFERRAEELGWPLWVPLANGHGKGSGKAAQKPLVNGHDQTGLGQDTDPLGLDNAPLGLTDDEIRHHIERLLPNTYSRDVWLGIGMGLNHQTDASEFGWETFDWFSQQYDGYNAEHTEKAWKSFKTRTDPKLRNITFRYVLKLAKERDATDRPGRIQFLSPDECVAQPPRRYIVKGLIAPGDVGCLFGMPGFGKSALAPLIAYHVALGEPIFGLRTKPGPALYIAAEDAPGMINRIAAIRQRYPDAPEFCLVTGIVDLLADGPDQKAIIAKIAEMKPSTVWIDTLAMAFADLDEIDNKEMNRVVKVCRQFTAHDAAAILLHHPPKAEGSKTPRGGGAFHGALDMAMQLMEKTDDGIVRGKLTKNRNGPCDLDIAFRLSVERLGTDEDGDAITAVIAEPITGAPRGNIKLAASEREGLKVFRELREQSEFVDEQSWRQLCDDAGTISTSSIPDNRRRAIDRVLLGLIRKECIKRTPSGQLQLVEDFDIDQGFRNDPDNPDNLGQNPDSPADNSSDNPDNPL